MTQRLRDLQEFASPDEAEAARLLRQLVPAVPPAMAEQRLFAKLGLRRRCAPRAMRLVVAASVTVIVTSVLGTALALSFHYLRPAQTPTVAMASRSRDTTGAIPSCQAQLMGQLKP